MACLAAPSDLGIEKMASDIGLRLVETHFIYVHGGLTRELVVLQVP